MRSASSAPTVERIATSPRRDRPQLGDLVVGRLDGDGPRLLLIGHMDTVFDPGTAAAAAVSVRGRAGDRAGRDRHEGRAAGRASTPSRRCRRPASDRRSRSSPTRTRRSARRSARRSSAPWRPSMTRCSSSSARAPTATSSARARASPTTTSRSPVARRTPASSRRRAAPRSSRRRTRCSPSTPSTADGRPSPSTRASSTAARGPNVVAGALRARRSTCGRPRSMRSTPPRPRSSAWPPSPTVDGVQRQRCRRIAGHPPMEKTDASARLVALAVEIAAELGFELRDAATGGASDANTTAALGHPDARRPRARSAATTTRSTSGSTSTASCRGRRCWRASSSHRGGALGASAASPYIPIYSARMPAKRVLISIDERILARIDDAVQRSGPDPQRVPGAGRHRRDRWERAAISAFAPAGPIRATSRGARPTALTQCEDSRRPIPD